MHLRNFSLMLLIWYKAQVSLSLILHLFWILTEMLSALCKEIVGFFPLFFKSLGG